jgi:hypothetical protein
MPTTSERHEAAQALLDAYMTTLVTDSITSLDADSSSNSDSSDSKSSSSSSSCSQSHDTVLYPSTSDVLLTALNGLYAQRYLAERISINKSSANLRLLLDDWKINRTEIFRTHLRITPTCFDMLVSVLQQDPVFHNQSHVDQLPIADQVAIALYRFGHHGNAVTTRDVALWAGIGYGTVRLVTNRVMKAVCGDSFRYAVLHWPDSNAKEEAKAWVEQNSCPAWRDGWCMVDGTLVPLYACPGFFGNTWFDCKSNYSLNVQVCF